MVSSIYYVTEKLNNISWQIGKNKGHEFEDFICMVIEDWCENNYLDQYNLYQTAGSNDNGKDIILEAKCSLDGLFNQKFVYSNNNLKIYFECKSSDSYKIDYNELAGNLVLSQYDSINYYVLITNSTITPYTLYQLEDEANKHNFRFVLIDQYALYCFLKGQNKMIGTYTPPVQKPQIHIEYQIFSERYEGKNRFCIYLLIRNYTKNTQKIDLQIKTDHNWTIEQEPLPKILESQKHICHMLIADKLYYDGLDELCLIMKSSVFEKIVSIKGMNISHNFLPPLHGNLHYQIIDEITKKIKQSSIFRIFYLYGQAGVGKTRIIEEISKKFNGTTTKSAFFICSLKGNIYSKVSKFLNKENLIPDNNWNNFKDIFQECKPLYKKYIIFIDDIHNEDSEFFEDIRSLSKLQLNIPITLVLLGRNDYSKGSPAYYSFMSQCINKVHPIDIYEVKMLKDQETRHFIQSIISDAPESVLKRIQTLSNNIPLYIVQFIQYLLDIKLVKIINRSTVGIINVETFSSRTELPKKIEDIYKSRINSLKKLPEGERLIDFMYMASFIGIEFSSKVYHNYFADNGELLELLFKRYFLTYTEEGKIKFIHESLYLYFENYLKNHKKYRKKIAKKLLSFERIFFSEMTNHDKGDVCFWADKLERSKIYFQDIISDIHNIENYSSIHIKSSYRNYLDVVFQLLCNLQYSEDYLKNALFCKIYLTLHTYTPYMAVKECENVEFIVNNSKQINDKDKFKLAILEQKAHSYINMGQLRNGESILQNLLAKMLFSPDSMDNNTKFDLYDKLTSINLKYNNYDVASNYNRLAFRIADEQNDNKLKALAEISRAKMLLYRNSSESENAILKAHDFLLKDNEKRINCHNNLSMLIKPLRTSLMKGVIDDLVLKDLKILYQEALDNNYANSILRSFVFLSSVMLWQDINKSLEFANQGIDASIRWGQANYMWHFYNLKAIIAIRQDQDIDFISKLFETVYRLLQRQNLLFWGSLDFTYDNILVMTNVMKFLQHYGFESDFYRKISSISYNESMFSCDYNCENEKCNFNCIQTTELYKREYKKISHGHLLLVDPHFSYSVKDKETGYYLPLS